MHNQMLLECIPSSDSHINCDGFKYVSACQFNLIDLFGIGLGLVWLEIFDCFDFGRYFLFSDSERTESIARIVGGDLLTPYTVVGSLCMSITCEKS